MTTGTMTEEISTLNICKEVEIAAPIDIAFQAVLAELGPDGEMGEGKPFPMTLEAWPGGRWFRDLGGNIGHLWGHVQVIKPPTLLEICGPMFMSYPAVSHLQYRLTANGQTTRLKLVHRAMGQILSEHREGVTEGWSASLASMQKIAAKLMAGRGR